MPQPSARTPRGRLPPGGATAAALATGTLARLGRPVVGIVAALALGGRILFWTFFGWTRGQGLRWPLVGRHVVETGLQGLPLAGLFGFAVGLVLALQITTVLDIANVLPLLLEGLGTLLTREVAPLMVGILVAARSGSSLTADLAAMQVNREIDALVGMGINPVRLLIAPVALALLVAVPGLTLMLAGFSLATIAVYLDVARSVPPQPVLASVLGAVSAGDLIVAIGKSLVFAGLIVTVAAAVGLAVRRSIGAGVTRAVVIAITGVLLANAGLTLAFPG
jgi:phospholipid/cholesterol/gamma-HCH transport system permease protein